MSSVSRLILAQGELEAQRRRERADFLGGSIAGVGQAVGGYLQQREMRRQDQAFMSFLEEWSKDPRPDTALMGAVKILGPKRGQEAAEGMLGYLKLASARDKSAVERQKVALEVAPQLALALDAAGPESRQRLFPGLAAEMNAAIPNLGLPEQLDEGQWPDILKMAQGLRKQEAKTREIKVRNPDGSESIMIVKDEPGQRFASAAEPEKEYEVEVPGPGGPVSKLVKASELRGGVQTYERPREPRQRSFTRASVTVPGADGKPKFMQANYDSQTGKYFDVDTGAELRGVAPAPTADERNRANGRQLAFTSINALRDLSKQVITKRGIAQRAVAMGRSIESVLGNDPVYKTYQDARMALAGNLAVAQQGSRPSDADIRAIWLPMVPDAINDTDESAALKWNLINKMMGSDEEPSSGSATRVGRFTVTQEP